MYEKEAVDKYDNNVKNQFDKVEDNRKGLIPHNAPISILYQLGRVMVNQFTAKIFAIFLTTDQETATCP